MIGLVVIGNGRTAMLDQAVEAAFQHLPPFDRYLMVDDSGDPKVRRHLDSMYPDFVIEHHAENLGMAAAVQAGFDLALDTGCRFVFWLEEDHLLVREVPVESAVAVLDRHQDLAQMTFSREPCDPSEGSDQLGAIVARSSVHGAEPEFTWYDFLFSMIPNLIPRRVLELGWPSGPLGVGNEAGMTRRCLDAGLRFASWGHVGDAPFVRHIGYANRGAAWQL